MSLNMSNLVGDWKCIQIFRSGVHTTSSGEGITFSEMDLDIMAVSYNELNDDGYKAPLCIGHPENNQPSFGETGGLINRDGKLYALIKPNTTLADNVKSGRYKKVSAAFYRPGDKQNPIGDRGWYLRHIGFLGAQPPAVKGMEPIVFGESLLLPSLYIDNNEYVEFSEYGCNFAENSRMQLHMLTQEISRTSGMAYSEALYFSENMMR